MHSPFQKTVLIICGPTAIGKSALALALARKFHTEIISADSRQCYKELNIGVARPTEAERKEIKHHFIASHSVTELVTAAAFEKIALEIVHDIFSRNDLVVMVGGTGLYIKAFCEGLDDIPEIPAAIRNHIVNRYEQEGFAWLQQELRQKDPAFFKKGEIKNPRRMIRALEVVEATGQSILTFRKGEKAERDFAIVKIGLELPKEVLHQRIHERVDTMIRSGLVDEVKQLQPFQHLPALQTVGYKELFAYLEGTVSLSQAIDDIKKNTRHYAKRQMTWFRKDKSVNWFSAQDPESIIPEIMLLLKD